MGNIHIHDNTFFHLVIVKKCGFNTIKRTKNKNKNISDFSSKKTKRIYGTKEEQPKKPQNTMRLGSSVNEKKSLVCFHVTLKEETNNQKKPLFIEIIRTRSQET